MTTRGARIAIVAALGLALSPAASAWGNTYVVSAGSSDVVDVNTADAGICDADPGAGVVCTLRAAVQTANSAGSPGFDTIQVPSEVYQLTIANTSGDENAAAQGDLDLTTSMEITGTGGQATIRGLASPAEDRLFHIPSGSPSVTLSNLTIEKGRAPADGWGGGIKHESGGLTVVNSTIHDNDALGDGAKGGGIYSSGGSSLTLTDVNVNANQAPPDASSSNGAQGGGVYSLTPVTFTRVAIYGNDANFGCGPLSCGGNGGGLYAGSGTLTNVTVSGNIAGGNSTTGSGGGGGIYGGALTLINSTIQHNYAMGPGGLAGGNLVGGDLRLQSTIISDGETIDHAAGKENCAVDNPPAFTSLGNNLEARAGQGASQCGLSPGVNGDITAMSAGLDPNLLFNGGPTPTHKLQAGSLAIDAGALSGPATDQRGVTRPQGSRCDIGAYELDQPGGTLPGWTCAGPPPPSGGGGTPGAGGTPTGTTPTPTSAATSKKCKKKRNRAAAAKKKCKKRR
jgi:hypothetical protein